MCSPDTIMFLLVSRSRGRCLRNRCKCYIGSGVNLDKCLVQDLSQLKCLEAVVEKYKSEQGSCKAIRVKKTSGHHFAY